MKTITENYNRKKIYNRYYAQFDVCLMITSIFSLKNLKWSVTNKSTSTSQWIAIKLMIKLFKNLNKVDVLMSIRYLCRVPFFHIYTCIRGISCFSFALNMQLHSAVLSLALLWFAYAPHFSSHIAAPTFWGSWEGQDCTNLSWCTNLVSTWRASHHRRANHLIQIFRTRISSKDWFC